MTESEFFKLSGAEQVKMIDKIVKGKAPKITG